MLYSQGAYLFIKSSLICFTWRGQDAQKGGGGGGGGGVGVQGPQVG